MLSTSCRCGSRWRPWRRSRPWHWRHTRRPARSRWEWARLLAVVARTSMFLVNLGFWVGSLWGDDLDWLHRPERGPPGRGVRAGLGGGAWWARACGPGRTDRRWVLNLVTVFAGIHFYTQWFEHLGRDARDRAAGRAGHAGLRRVPMARQPAPGHGRPQGLGDQQPDRSIIGSCQPWPSRRLCRRWRSCAVAFLLPLDATRMAACSR